MIGKPRDWVIFIKPKFGICDKLWSKILLISFLDAQLMVLQVVVKRSKWLSLDSSIPAHQKFVKEWLSKNTMKQEQRHRLSLLEGGREEPGSCSNRQKSPSLGPLAHTNPLPSVSLPPSPTYLSFDYYHLSIYDDDMIVFASATAAIISHSFLIALNGWNTSLQSKWMLWW